MMILREELYSISSNTQSRKMPLPSRSDRTFLFDVPKDPINDGGNRQSDQLQENPMKKRSIESCTGRLHGERLNVFQLTSLTESQQIIDGWVQWGIDQQFYLMGYLVAATAWAQLEIKLPYPNAKTGGVLVTAENLPTVQESTNIWVEKAKAYGFM